jgi:cell division protein FtsZ
MKREIDIVRGLIQENKLSEAISKLLSIDQSHESELVQINGRLSSVENKNRLGVISNEEETIEVNRIRKSITEIYRQLLTSNEEDRLLKIGIFGVGGAGGVNLEYIKLKDFDYENIGYISINRDAGALQAKQADVKININKNNAKFSADPLINFELATNNIEEIKKEIANYDVVIIVSGFGGGCGSGVSPLIAETAKEQGKVVFSVNTLPFVFEGQRRVQNGLACAKLTIPNTDLLFAYNSNLIMGILDKKTTFNQAFYMLNEVAYINIKILLSFLLKYEPINHKNINFLNLIQNVGYSTFAIGLSEEKNGVLDAVEKALTDKAFTLSLKDPQKVFMFVASSKQLTKEDAAKAYFLLKNNLSYQTEIYYGISRKQLSDGFTMVGIIASDYKQANVDNIYLDLDEKKQYDNESYFLKKDIYEITRKVVL